MSSRRLGTTKWPPEKLCRDRCQKRKIGPCLVPRRRKKPATCGHKDRPKSTPMTRTRNRGAYFSPALPRDSLECRVAMRARGGVTSPTPQWSALGILDQRSYRWLRRRIRESLFPPSRRQSRMSDRNKVQRVPALGFPAPRRSLSGEGDLPAVEARLIADHGTSAALTLQAVAHGDARWLPLNLKTELPATAGGTSGHHRFAPRLSIGRRILRMSGRFGL